MKNLIRFNFAVVATAISLSAFAQNTFNGADTFVTGPQPPFNNWNPGGDPALQLKNDGTSGDVTASDNLWSVDVNTTVPAAAIGDRVEWKAAHAGWSWSTPGSGNAWTRATGGTVKYILDNTVHNDGYQPDVDGTTVRGIAYTVPAPVVSGDQVRVVGDFITHLGGANWTPNENAGLMNDAGTNGDTAAGDGIYTLSFTNVPAGSYQLKLTVNGTWDKQAGWWGYSTDAGNLNMNILANTDQVRILFDSAKGRTKIENNNPLLNPGPPFYATSTLWGTVLGASTQLYDDGTNGDVVSGDGIHSRTFTTTDNGQKGIQIKQGSGPQYPASGDGYPADVATTGQQVLVQFDTNTRADGYLPSTRYMWVNPAARRNITTVQPVGSWQSEAGGSDWSPGDTLFNIFDNGSNGDLTSGDKVFGGEFPLIDPSAPASPTVYNYKAVAGVDGGGASYTFQFGGPGEGFTFNGNNPNLDVTASANQTINFQVDTVTGRVAAFVRTSGPSNATAPQRPATIDAAPNSAVSDWSMY